jgi:hypothetical protein
MAKRMRPSSNVALAALVALLGYLNWYAWEVPIETAPISTGGTDQASGQPDAEKKPPQIAKRSLSEFSETIARPLFHPSRRPITVEAAQQPPAPEPPPVPEAEAQEPSGLSLVGLMVAGEKGRRALIRPEGEAYGTWVEEGGKIAGWELTSIYDDRVFIEKSGRQEELVLDRNTPN